MVKLVAIVGAGAGAAVLLGYSIRRKTSGRWGRSLVCQSTDQLGLEFAFIIDGDIPGWWVHNGNNDDSDRCATRSRGLLHFNWIHGMSNESRIVHMG